MKLPTKTIASIIAASVAVVGVGTIAIGMAHQSETLGKQTADAHHQCEQSLTYSCAPASIVELLSWLGIVVTEKEMEALCKTDRHGTHLEAIRDALLAKLPAGSTATILLKLPPPTAGALYIVEIDQDPLDEHKTMHAICARGIDGARWYVNDPARGEAETWMVADMDHVLRAIEVRTP